METVGTFHSNAYIDRRAYRVFQQASLCILRLVQVSPSEPKANFRCQENRRKKSRLPWTGIGLFHSSEGGNHSGLTPLKPNHPVSPISTDT